MITSDPVQLALSFAAGTIAGGLFFVGLWLTVQRLAVTQHPAGLVLFSFIVRVAIILGVLYLVGRDHIDRMLTCLLGFLLARLVVMRVTGNRADSRPKSGKEVGSAPQS